MICNVGNCPIAALTTIAGYHVCEISLIYLYINFKCRAKGSDLHIIAVSTTFGHALKMALENPVNLFSSR